MTVLSGNKTSKWIQTMGDQEVEEMEERDKYLIKTTSEELIIPRTSFHTYPST